MKMTRGRLKEIITEEIQTFILSLREEVLKEQKLKPEDLKSLIEQLEYQDGN
jgi:hypothetical protein|tara:strand:- start:170 stop:325 length:156 start_codon:yes stop_codon:yes gene_type:complete